VILRRLIEHLKQQHWTAVGIDLLIVILGVFIGTQVSNWNTARLERDLARGDLSQVAADLREQLAFQKTMESSARLRISAVDYIHREAFGKALPAEIVLATETWKAPPAEPFPADRLDHLLGAVNLVRVSVRSRNAYESMISSGRLAQLQNRALADRILRYYGDYDDFIATSLMFRSFRNEGVRDQYPLGVSVFEARPAAEVVALARENQGFAAYIRSQREWAILHHNLLQDIGGKTTALLGAIEQELAQP